MFKYASDALFNELFTFLYTCLARKSEYWIQNGKSASNYILESKALYTNVFLLVQKSEKIIWYILWSVKYENRIIQNIDMIKKTN